MTKKYKLYQVDSFTKEKLIGNPAGGNYKCRWAS